MLEYTDYIKIFIALLAVVDPLGVAPIIAALTTRVGDAELKKIALTVAFTVSTILLLALFIGENMLIFFGISIHSFMVSGGILLMLMSISMLQARTSETVHNKVEAKEGEAKESIAVVPLSMPLLAGPGAISTVILYGQSGSGYRHFVFMTVDIVLVVAILWVVISCIPWLARHLSRTGINIFTRLMGLILSALAVEFIATGIKGLFPALAVH
ncbi:NAAT family transporter [Methylosarcina fibrata]|uniref:NAAT family transporter n=1 Tax=Methylosarcina fibrata TaxID=105972 RepID=UPI00037D650B|nr:NAAT family transporter [Methylosarcina fibrata]